MKKLLLILFAVAFGLTAMAQRKITTPVAPYKAIHQSVENYLDKDLTNLPPANTPAPLKGTSTLTPVFIGASINIFGLLLEEQTTLWYDKAVNAIMQTARGNNYGTLGVLGTGDDLNNYYSLDGGSSWSGQTALQRGTGTGKYRHRYPSGVIYNPVGNTDVANTFSVMAGPRTDGSAWIASYHGVAKYDLSDTSATYPPLGMNELVRDGMTSAGDGIFALSGCGYLTSYTSAHIYAHHGLWNSANNAPDWGVVDLDMADYVFANPTDNTLTMYFGWSNGSFSKDGTVGYLVVRGSDKRPTLHPSYSPIIWKTTDGGQSWNELPYFDFGTLPEIQNWILPVISDPNTYLPYFDNIDIIVDYLGLPHIFAAVRGCYSSNPDSLGYVYIAASDGHCIDNNVFELYMDETSNWHAVWVDSIVTDDPDATVSPYTSSSGNVGWSHRIQAGRTDDGTKVFVTWTESDYKTWATERYNFNPDLKIWGRNIFSSEGTAVKNVTAGDPNLWGMVYFHFFSPTVMDDAGVYSFPVTYEDIATNGLNADLPPYTYYIQGVQLVESDFPVGIPTPASSKVKVTNCYPNPVSGTTSFDVTVNKNTNVTVTTSNVTGQAVSTINFGTFAPGTHKITIDASGLSSGVYMNNIQVGDERYSNKMIVK